RLAAQTASDYERQGESDYFDGFYASAVDNFTKAIALDPNNFDAYLYRGKTEIQTADLDAAIADLSRAIELRPKDATAYFQLGRARDDKGDTGAAITDYDAAIELDPKNEMAYNARGVVKARKGDVDGAIADYTRAIEIAPEDFDVAYFNRGTMKQDKGDLDGAIADFTRAIGINPKDPDYYNGRASAKFDQDDFDGAIADSTNTIVLDTKDPENYRIRALFEINKGDLDGAVADYGRAIGIDPEDSSNYAERSVARLVQGRFAETLADCNQTIALDPDYSDYAYLLREVTSRRLGNAPANFAKPLAEWKDDFRKTLGQYLAGGLDEAGLLAAAAKGEAKEVPGQQCEACYFIGMTHLIAGDSAGARAFFAKSVGTRQKTHPGYLIARAEIARLDQPPTARDFIDAGNKKFFAGDYDAAIANFDVALKLDPKNARAYDDRGTAKLCKGDPDGSRTDFTHALEIDPKDALALLVRGNAKQVQGNFFYAARDYLDAIALDPDHSFQAYLYLQVTFLQMNDAVSDFPKLVEGWKDGWTKTNGRYLEGLLGVDEYLAAAAKGEAKDIPGQQCEADYFVGMMHLATGDKAGARDFFTRSVSAGAATHSSTYFLARAELAWLDQHPLAPAVDDLVKAGKKKDSAEDYAGAIAAYDEALKLDPQNATAVEDRAAIKLGIGDPDGAIADFTQVLAIDPNDAVALLIRGKARQIQGDYAGAVKDFDASIALKPNDSYTTVLHRQLALRQLGNASADFAQTVAAWGEGWEKSNGQYLAGSLDEAQFLAAAAQGDPKRVSSQLCESYYYTGMTHLIAGDKIGARDFFAKSIATGATELLIHDLARAELARLSPAKSAP
ncbi:MAG TPA: tetratricopeptide repeat protein, partial [Opitutales bacterium]|nr:tetratricopeptide repeat protein [Opitutales bacterium]